MPTLPQSPVVDTHSHVIADDAVRFPVAPMGGHQSAWSKERPVNDAGMLEAMRAAGIAQSVLVQISTCYGNDNSYVIDCVKRDPGHFVGVFSVDFNAPDAVERIQQHMDQGMAGVRVFVAGHTAANVEVRLEDPRATPAWNYLARTRIPVCTQLRADKLDQLQVVLERHPGLVVLLDHAARPVLDDGAPYAKAQSLFDLARYPDLYVKFTTHILRDSREGAATPTSFVEALAKHFGPQRIAWGSNFPASPGSLTEQLQQALDATATLSADDREWIFSRTARTVYPQLGEA